MSGQVKHSDDFEAWKRWGSAVIELSERLGWPRVDLWKWFGELSLMASFELRLPADAAEDSAWRLLCGLVEKQEWMQ